VTFYVFGLTPNKARISQKFIYKDNFGNIIKNIVQHQKDMAMSKKAVEDGKPVTFRDIFKELISPNSTSEKVSSPLMSAVMLSAFQGTEYPNALLENVVRRVKIDQDNKDNKDKQNKYIKMNDVRVGIIKGYINRNLRLKGNKEEFQMSLDLENRNPAYLCGRMFAVCEKIQMEALGKELNQTIKDSYFASACASPSVVFPNLLKLSQNHLANIRKKSPVDKNPSVYYQIIMGEIMDKLVGEFPSTLSLEDQGRFIIGYYHQNRDFFVSKKGVEPTVAPTNENN
jgi:CRISPR-associated protein Csd1